MKARKSRVARRPLFAAIVVGLSLTAAGDRARGQTALPATVEESGVVPDSTGAIAEVMLQYDPDLATELEPVYRDLLGALPSDAGVTVICPSARAAQEYIDTWGPYLRSRSTHVINVGLPLSIWARDRCISRQPAGFRGRAESFVPVRDWTYEAEKLNDLLALEVLGQGRLMPSVLDSSVHVEGGNVVSNTRHVFVGANVVGDNHTLSDDELANELRRVFGREYILVGDEGGEVPWCHVDMYLTPIDDDTLLVSSPRMAAEMLSNDDEDDEWGLKDHLGYGVCLSDAVLERFDSVAHLVASNGYRVLRLPALVGATQDWMVTYNNVLMDFRARRRTVYMPVYGIPELDTAAAAIYRGLGFHVQTVDVSEVYYLGGAVRCIANVTERRPSNTPRMKGAQNRGIRLIDLAGFSGYERLLHKSGERLARRTTRATLRRSVSQ